MESREMKILVVDDNQDNLTILNTLVLEFFPNTRVLSALNGQKGLELAISEEPDIILLDIIMPGMDGYEVYRRLKSDEKLCDIPVIFVTAIRSDKESRIRALECGAEAFLTKPIDESELTAQLRAMFMIRQAILAKKTESERLSLLVEEKIAEYKRENTKRIQSEEALLEAQELAHIGSFEFDMKTNLLSCTDEGLRICNISQDDLDEAQEKLLECVHPDDRATMFEMNQKAIFERETVEFFCRMIRQNGEVRHVFIRVRPIFDDNGNCVKTSGIIQDVTESKLREAQLNQNMKDLLESQRIAHVGTWSLDLATNQVVWSEELYKMYGFDSRFPPPPYTEHMKLFTPESWQKLSTALKRTRTTGVPYELELETITKDGSNGWMWVRGKAKTDQNGGIVSLWGAAQDITESKKEKYALIESEEKFRYLFENSAVGKSVTLPSGEIKFNNTMCRMLGYSAEELKNKKWQELTHSDDIEATEREIREVISGYKESMRFNKRYIKKDGSIMWADVLSTVRRDLDGTPIYFMTSIIDITEKVEAQELFKQSEDMYRTFIDASADMIFLKDEQFRHIVANSKLVEFFNKPRNEIIGKTDYELMPENAANQCRVADLTAVSTKTSIISEEIIGDNVYETTKFPVMLRDNKAGIGGFIRDITERKQKENRISQLNRLYATLSQINQSIVRISDQDELLKSACNIAIEFGKYRMAWIGLVNEIDSMVIPIAFSGEEDGYLSEIEINYLDEKLGSGPTGTAIREERCVISHNIATDVNMLAWQKPALQRNYKSSAAIPIYKNGRIFGALSVYSTELNGFDSEDEGLLVEIGVDISFALDKIESEENRRRAVAALEQSEQKNRSYIENAPDGVVIIDEMGQFIEVNKAATEMTGYTKDELTRMNIIDVLPDESIFEGRNGFKKLVETGSVKGALQYRYHEGSTRWFSVDAIKLNDHRFLAFIKDVTARIKAEEELKENEEKYRLLYTSMSQGLALHEIITDENGNPIDYVFLDINESYMHLLDVTREMCIGKRVTEVMPKVEQYWIDVFGRVALTGEPFYYENYFETTGGYYATYTYSPKKRQFAVLVTDITERKNNEKKLEHLSYHDQLTGLYNRRFFEEEFRRLDTKRNLPISLIMADINGLKIINDSFGHTVGDNYLIRLAEILKTTCRADEIIARLGGDEFVVILPNTDVEETAKIVKRMKDEISKTNIGNIELSVSFGYDTKLKEDQSVSDILVSAENHMYTHKIAERKSIRSKTVEMIMGTLFEKSGREAQHSQRVSEICKDIAIKLNFDKDEVEQIRIAGLVHDIGKIGISEEILNKTSDLENAERTEINRHPEAGWRILNTTTEFSEVALIVLHHHEKFDGSGYPSGIKGEEIPMQARIIAIADAYDAMTSERSYRKAISHEEAMVEIKRCSGTHFDPAIVDLFVR